MKISPFLIGTLNRNEHLKRALDSLKKNHYSSETDLFVALDYPSKDSHQHGYEKNIEYLNKIDGFKNIELIIRNENLGPTKNFDMARNEIFKYYDSIIVSEDDNYFSHDFLSFMNRSLEIFKDREDIFSICGYSYPTKVPFSSRNTFAYDGFSSWGYGIWKEKFEKVNWSVSYIEDKMKSKNFRSKIKANHLLRDLDNILHTGVATKDTQICLHQIDNNLFSIFPTISRVKNFGHDGSGLHSTMDSRDLYLNQKLYQGSSNYKIDKNLKVDYEIIERVNKFLNKNSYLKYLLNPIKIATNAYRLIKRIFR